MASRREAIGRRTGERIHPIGLCAGVEFDLELDALVESLPLWPLMETTVTPLTTFEGRIQAVQSKLKQRKSLVQDPAGVIEGVT